MSRDPRRAYDKDGQEIPPATMANIREQGINTLWATCQRIGCGHEEKIRVAVSRRHAGAGCRPSPEVQQVRRPERLHDGRLVTERLASAAVATAVRLQPDYSVAWVERASPLIHASDRARYCDILRPVGLPEA
jgi:hypothetical protein